MDKFSHDIPLQRSLSLDGGKEIFKYLQTLGSDWSVGSSSSWTVHSDDRSERYRSFEEIPASPRAKSRRASFDRDNSFGSGLALSVLKDRYKGFDSSNDIAPQIKRLRNNFSFHDSLQDFKAVIVKDEEVQVEKENELEVRQPIYRNISVAQYNPDTEEKLTNPRQRKLAIPLRRNLSFEKKPEVNLRKPIPLQRNLSFEGLKKPEVNLRKEILKLTVPNFKSCEDLSSRTNTKVARRESAENVVKSALGLMLLKDRYQGIEPGNTNISSSIQKLKRNFSFVSPPDARDAPTIDVHDVDRRISDAKYKNISTNTSNVVEISRNCDCRICSEEDREDGRSVWRRIFCKLFMRTVSIKDERKAYWDENNNLDEGEMYKCIIHTLKLLFGLWLRHLDHN